MEPSDLSKEQVRRLPPPVKRLVRHAIANPSPPQRSAGWLNARNNALTSSDVATVLGENPYATRISVLHKKLNPSRRFFGNVATEHGQKYEDEALRLYEKREGRTVISFGLLFHPRKDLKWLGGSPDGITTCGRLLEIKCPYRRQIGDGAIPPHYMAQVQTLMAITGLEVCDFVQYRPPNPPNFPDPIYTCVEIPRSNDWFKARLPVMRDFWKTTLFVRGISDALDRTRALVATAAASEGISISKPLYNLWVSSRKNLPAESDTEALARLRDGIGQLALVPDHDRITKLWGRITAADRKDDLCNPTLIRRRNNKRKRKRTYVVDYTSNCKIPD